MKRILLFLTFLVSILPLSVHGVTVTTSSYVLAPLCCEVADVQIINTVSISNPEPFWANQSFSHLWYADAYWCDGTFNNFAETCCIGSGNTRIVKTFWNGLACPVAAQGRSYGWIGGGSLPYHEHQSASPCTQPCYCL